LVPAPLPLEFCDPAILLQELWKMNYGASDGSKDVKFTIFFVTMGQVVEEFSWAKSRMRSHTLRTDNTVFVGTMFLLHFRK